MSSFLKKSLYGIALILGAVAFFGCSQPTDPPADIAWTVAADGGAVASSTKLDFTFAGAVSGLTAEQIAVTDDSGAVTKGSLTGDGANWSLGITVQTAGNVKVTVNKGGIEAAEKSVTVFKLVDPGDNTDPGDDVAALTWTAEADGANGTSDSTLIAFTFSAAVAELSADDIVIANDTGDVAKGTLAKSETGWTLGITVNTAGNVKVKINKTGIEDTEKNVAVYKTDQVVVISWEAEADDTANTTALVFAFNAGVTGLSADSITITNDTGSVTKGTLDGSGAAWTLGITVNTAGNIKVAITSEGIEDTERTIAVYKAPVAYDLEADGEEDTITTTAITFTFSEAVSGLTKEDISVADSTGSVTTGELRGSGTDWSLEITGVKTAGMVKIAINKPGIEDAEKEAAVYKALVYTDEVEIGYTTANSSGVGTAGEPVEEGPLLTVGMEAVEAGVVHFAIGKNAGQTISVDGADKSKVTVYTDGTVIDGDVSSDTWALVVVRTGMRPFTGGSMDMVINVHESGALSRAVAVDLAITTNKTGAAVFIVARPEGQTYADGDDNVVLTRVDNNVTSFKDAVIHVEDNAEANKEYLVRVENNETGLRNYRLAFNMEENVTLRLKGSKNGTDGEVWTRTLKHGGSSGTDVNNRSNEFALFQIGGGDPGGGDTAHPKRTFILDSNITMEGTGTSESSRYRSLFYVDRNATLALRPGAAITKYYATTKMVAMSPIIVDKVDSNPNRDPELSGSVRLEGGSITDCKFDNVGDKNNTHANLISFQNTEANCALGSFYKAASVVISGNVNHQGEAANEVCFNAGSNAPLETIYTLINGEELSLPAE
jgi:hypothetical protein